MTPTLSTEHLIRRILVALDASAHSLAALEAAAELAALHEAELLGLFVEDATLVRVARLGGVREIDLYSTERRHLDPSAVEQMFRRQATHARETLRQMADRTGVRSVTFRVARGEVVAELVRAAGEADLLSVGTRGWVPGRRPGSTVRRLLRKAGTPPVLVLRSGARLGPTVYVLDDGTESAARAARVAATIAARREAPLTVLVLGEEEEAARRADTLRDELAGTGADVRARRLAPAELPGLPDLLAGRRCGLFVVAHRDAGGSVDADDLLRRLPCPVLVVD